VICADVSEMADDKYSMVVLGRIHISQWVRDALEFRLCELVTKSEKYIQEKGKGKDKFIWIFLEGKVIEFDVETKIVYAQLAKINKNFEDKYLDEPTRSIKTIVSDQPRVVSVSNFIIDLKSQTVLFEEKPHISIKQFMQIFSTLYRRYFKDLSNIKIDPVIESDKIFEILGQYDKIISANFKVTPSNPEDEDDFRKLDALLKKSDTAEANLKFKSDGNESGLNIKEDTIVREAIALSGAGYGNYTIIAKRGEETTILKSDDQIFRTTVLAFEDTEDMANSLFKKLKELSKGKAA
jgi:hypothetical protein